MYPGQGTHGAKCLLAKTCWPASAPLGIQGLNWPVYQTVVMFVGWGRRLCCPMYILAVALSSQWPCPTPSPLPPFTPRSLLFLSVNPHCSGCRVTIIIISEQDCPSLRLLVPVPEEWLWHRGSWETYLIFSQASEHEIGQSVYASLERIWFQELLWQLPLVPG